MNNFDILLNILLKPVSLGMNLFNFYFPLSSMYTPVFNIPTPIKVIKPKLVPDKQTIQLQLEDYSFKLTPVKKAVPIMTSTSVLTTTKTFNTNHKNITKTFLKTNATTHELTLKPLTFGIIIH